MTTPSRVILALALGVPGLAEARVEVLTAGKFARFANRRDPVRTGGVVRVGRERALKVLHDPTCPTTSRVEIVSNVDSSARHVLLAIDLQCAKWERRGGGWRYRDRDGAARTIRYAPGGLRLAVSGRGFGPVLSPVDVLQAQLAIGDTTLRVRLENFMTDASGKMVTRRPSRDAAAGEAAFFDVLLGDDTSQGRQEGAIAALERAVKADRHDGRSRFLLGGLHLYRFSRLAPGVAPASPEAHAEIRASHELLQEARALLWDGTRGDSRVLVFAANARYLLGVATNDAEMRAQGVADLAEASRANALFSDFGYATIIASAPRTSVEFAEAFAAFDAYVSSVDPACIATLPELCSNAGMALRNFPGSPLVFGDIYAKAGDLARAQQWYAIALAFGTIDYRFADVLADRSKTTAERVALYLDADPTNDPPTILIGGQACAFCHNR